MKILLINPGTDKYTRTVCTPLGLLSIATYLDANGHEVKLLNRTVISTDIKKELSDFKPDIIGVSVYSVMSFKDSVLVSNAAKSADIPVVWGGPFVSSVPEVTLKTGCVDMVSIGEGEATWLEIANCLRDKGDFCRIQGLAMMKNGSFFRTPDRPFMDLSLLPPINFKFIDVKAILHTEYTYDGVFGLYLSKGCTAQCTFCYNTEFHKCKYRKRPVEHFLQEARTLIEEYGMKAVSFTDELFCPSRQELHELCDAIKESGLKFFWGCMTRVGIYTQEDYNLMYECGCRWIEYGVESGSPEVLKRIHKGTSVDKIAETFEMTANAGIIALAYFIVGFPDETREQLQETVNLLQSIKKSRSIASYYSPLPGSVLYKELLAEGKITPVTNLMDYGKGKIFYSPKPNFSKIPSKELKVVRSRFLWKSFSNKFFMKNNTRSYSVAKKDIEDIFENMRGHGAKNAIHLFFLSAYEFSDIFFYANFFPGIRKKYHLE